MRKRAAGVWQRVVARTATAAANHIPCLQLSRCLASCYGYCRSNGACSHPCGASSRHLPGTVHGGMRTTDCRPLQWKTEEDILNADIYFVITEPSKVFLYSILRKPNKSYCAKTTNAVESHFKGWRHQNYRGPFPHAMVSVRVLPADEQQ